MPLHKRWGIIAAVMITALVACSDTASPDPDPSPLTGLRQGASNDTGTSAPPTPNSGPGYFRGTVMAPSPPGSTGDTLATAPRLGSVKVTIYPRIGTSLPPAAGDEAGTVTTGADGLFQLPTLPAGEYIVTFVPPAGSAYAGVYVFGPLHEQSADYPWWVTLPPK